MQDVADRKAIMLTGILLAGGRSRRMGRDKALLELGGETVARRLLRVLRECAEELIIVGNAPERFEREDVPVIPDDAPGLGVVGGIATGIRAMRGETGIVIACDMPFLSGDLLRFVAASVGDADGALIESEKGYEPLCAAYRKTLLPTLDRMIAEGDLAAQRIVERGNLRVLDVAELECAGFDRRRLFNMNTPEDWETARRLLSELA